MDKIRKLYVISDLHLGGRPGFQMCSPESQARLVRFIQYVTEQAKRGPVHLLVNGDIVDFLAEAPWEAFTSDAAGSLKKLYQIFDHTASVWEAWQKFLAAEYAQLTLLIGNHDAELSFAEVRQALRRKLGKGYLDIIHDNEAFVDGPVLIEHGNRYDKWNAVPHQILRDYCSRLSRREPGAVVPSIPGSKLVVQVMNRFKQNFPFLDQLKPEIHMAIPLMLAVEPAFIHALPEFLELWEEQRSIKLQDKHGNTLSPYVAGQMASPIALGSTEMSADESELYAELYELAAQAMAMAADAANARPAADAADADTNDEAPASADELRGQVGGTLRPTPTQPGSGVKLRNYAQAGLSLLKVLMRRKPSEQADQIASLGETLRTFLPQMQMAFDVGKEEELYMAPARRAILEGGFQVVLYGHTHLAKQVNVPESGSGAPKGIYINTGTWADLMRIPEHLLAPTVDGKQFLTAFTAELRQTGTSRLRAQNPTYALVEFDSQVKAQLLTFKDTEPAAPVQR